MGAHLGSKLEMRPLFDNFKWRLSFVFAWITVSCHTMGIGGMYEIRESKVIGGEGGKIIMELPGMEIQEVLVSIPPGALPKQEVVTIALVHPREIIIRSGVPSRVFLRLEVSNTERFQEPLSITCRYKPLESRGRFAMPYSIDENNQLQLLDKLAEVSEEGMITFSTFIPIVFTLIFVEM